MPREEYFYIDIELDTNRVVSAGSGPNAVLNQTPDEHNIYRLYVSKGQYHKLMRFLDI